MNHTPEGPTLGDPSQGGGAYPRPFVMHPDAYEALTGETIDRPDPLYKAIARVRGLCREHGTCEADLERLVSAYREAVGKDANYQSATSSPRISSTDEARQLADWMEANSGYVTPVRVLREQADEIDRLHRIEAVIRWWDADPDAEFEDVLERLRALTTREEDRDE